MLSKPRMHLFVAWPLFAFLIVLPSEVLSQNCDILAKYGLWDYYSTSTDQSREDSYINWFCQRSSQADANNFNANLGLPIDEVPIEIGGGGGSSNSYQQSSCSLQAKSSDQRSHFSGYVKRISEKLVETIGKCLAQKGLHAWIEQTEDPHDFVIHLSFNSPSNKYSSAKVNNSTFSPSGKITCGQVGFWEQMKSQSDDGLIVDGSGRHLSCTRITDDPVTVVINSDYAIVEGPTLSLGRVRKRADATVSISQAKQWFAHLRTIAGVSSRWLVPENQSCSNDSAAVTTHDGGENSLIRLIDLNGGDIRDGDPVVVACRAAKLYLRLGADGKLNFSPSQDRDSVFTVNHRHSLTASSISAGGVVPEHDWISLTAANGNEVAAPDNAKANATGPFSDESLLEMDLATTYADTHKFLDFSR